MATTRRPGLSAKEHRSNSVDVHVGSRVRLRRNMLGWSQEKLGGMIGLTFQQIQKYERGANRIAASKLHELSRIMGVTVQFFFDTEDPVYAAPITPDETSYDDPMRRSETLELVDAYYSIEDTGIRRQFLGLARELAK